MHLLNFAFIKLTTCLIIGIVIGSTYTISLPLSLGITASLSVILSFCYVIARKPFVQNGWFGIVSLVSMLSIGVLVVNIHDNKNSLKHYTNQISVENDALNVITFRIKEVLKPGIFHDKYVIDLLKINENQVNGKSLLSIEKDSTKTPLRVDDIFTCKMAFKAITPPLNPNQFNYKNYLNKKYIYHQLFTSNEALFKRSSERHTLYGWADNIRNHINQKLKHYNFKPDELAIINALLLGQRHDIDKDIYSNFVNAGAIHILAVSGLHVGIILMILNVMLSPFKRMAYGNLITTIIIVILLWCFALIAGLSPSVTRAVTMFSILTVAMNLKRPTHIYNTLAISMFLILLFKPLALFDVGFQLSYLAVLAIVTLDPLIYKRWKPKSKLVDFYWHTFTVTVSAQLGILPLSLFYFHQFPGLFFISNMVIIPCLGVVLGFGILVIALALLNWLPQFIADAYEYIIAFMKVFAGWVSKQETFLFKDIPFSILNLLAVYLIIIGLIKLLKKWHYSNLRYVLFTVAIFQGILVYNNFVKQDNAFIIFHKNRHSLIGHTTHHKIVISHDLEPPNTSEHGIIRDYIVNNHIEVVENDSLQSIYLFNNKKLLVVDSLGIYNIKSFEPDYVLLRQSPKINLNRLIDSITPKYVIADGSNYKSYIETWKGICKKRKLPFHQTDKQGAFIIRY